MRNLFKVLFFLFSIISPPLFAQLKFKLSFGGSGDEQGRDLIQLPNKEYILVGAASESNLTNSDFYIIKTAENGLKLWEKKLGTNQLEFANSVFHDSIINKIIVSGFVSNQQTGYDGLIMVVNDNGDSLTSYQVGRNSWDFINSSTFSAVDSTWLFAGVSYNEISGNKEGWVFKINSDGILIWQAFIADNNKQIELSSIAVSSNNEILISGKQVSLTNQNEDYYYAKLTIYGDFIWQKLFDFGNNEGCNQIVEAENGDLFSIGYTNSRGLGGYDYILIKSNELGDTLSVITHGYPEDEYGISIGIAEDSNLYFTGLIKSSIFEQILVSRFLNNFIFLDQTSHLAANSSNDLSLYKSYPFSLIVPYDTSAAIIGTVFNSNENNNDLLFIKTDKFGFSSTSINKIENLSDFKLSPNPCNEFLNINCNVGNIQFQLKDLQGRSIISKIIFCNEKIDITMLESGFYIVNLFDSENIVLLSSKIIKL